MHNRFCDPHRQPKFQPISPIPAGINNCPMRGPKDGSKARKTVPSRTNPTDLTVVVRHEYWNWTLRFATVLIFSCCCLFGDPSETCGPYLIFVCLFFMLILWVASGCLAESVCCLQFTTTLRLSERSRLTNAFSFLFSPCTARSRTLILNKKNR